MMTQKVKDYILYEYKITSHSRFASAEKACDRCYGIMMFVTNVVLDYNSSESKELVSWWEDEMLPRFRKLEIERGR